MSIQNQKIKTATVCFICIIAGILVLSCCSPVYRELSPGDASRIDFKPSSYGVQWDTSLPEKEGIDPAYIYRLYANAEELESIYSLLVVKNGKLIAEGYYQGSSETRSELTNSMTKSYTGALVGIAIDKGLIESTDEHMLEFFPDLSPYVTEPAKKRITLEHLLQMRAGFPWEEDSQEFFEILYSGFHYSTFMDIPLIREPGSEFDYSNLSSHLLSIIATKAVGTDLLEFANENLNSKIGIQPTRWRKSWEGYRTGHGDLYLTAREMARFGQLYLDRGVYQGEQIISSQWIEDSFKRYTHNAWRYRVGPNFNDIGYGYQWWAVHSGFYDYHLAWGHGGQQIAIIDELNMVVVITAPSLWGEHSSRAWKLEKSNLNLVANFVASLPQQELIGDEL